MKTKFTTRGKFAAGTPLRTRYSDPAARRSYALLRRIVGEVKDGSMSFDVFAASTIVTWDGLARDILRRWDTPTWFDAEDVRQELLIAAWTYLQKFDASRGVPLHKFLTWNAYDKAKKRVHRVRGAKLHSKADYNPSRYELLDRAPPKGDKERSDFATRKEASTPTISDEIVAMENLQSALDVCDTEKERMLVLLMSAEQDIERAAMRLYGDPETRLACRLGCEQAAVRIVRATARDVAHRLQHAS